MISVGIDELSVALLMLAVSLTVALGFKGTNPDTPRARLIAQSDVARSREKNETAIYRSRLSYSGFKISYEGSKTVHDIFQKMLSGISSSPCLGWKVSTNTTFTWITYAEVFERAKNLGSGLVSLGLAKDGLVGILLPNGPEWIIADLAAMGFSFISVVINDGLQKEDVERIVKQTNLSVLICSDARITEILEFAEGASSLQHVIVVGNQPSNFSTSLKIHSLKDVENLGKQSPQPYVASAPTAPTSISYSSGSEKGVVLTQQNLVSSINAFLSALPSGVALKKGDKYFSYLSLALPLERVHVLSTLVLGGQVGFGNDLSKIFDDIRDLKPNFFVSVPRLWTLIYFKILHFVQKSGAIQRGLFQYVFDQRKKSLQKGILEKNSLWDSLIFNNFKEILGGNIRFLISTSEGLSPEVGNFLRICFGCNVFEGYYQAESCGFASLTIPGDYETGHVGTPLPCNEIKLIDIPDLSYFATDKPNPRGEICIRGPNIFREYFNNPEGSKQVIDEQGWYHTGDIGTWLPTRTLKIIGRKSQAVKLGEDVIHLDALENIYSRSPFISQISLSLTPSKSIEATIVPNPEAILDWAKANKISGDIPDLCSNPKVVEAVLKDLKDLASKNGLRPAEAVFKFSIQPIPFAKHLLTPTLKLRRRIFLA